MNNIIQTAPYKKVEELLVQPNIYTDNNPLKSSFAVYLFVSLRHFSGIPVTMIA